MSLRRQDIHIHLDSPITLIIQTASPPPTPGPAATAHLKIGAIMPGAITVDTTNETATVTFTDDHGNPTDPPAGATPSFTSDNDQVATVAADATNPLQADITPVGLGTATIAVSFNGTALKADGVTPIEDPAPVTVTVSPGPAAAEQFALSA